MRHRSSIRKVLSFAAIFWLVFSSSAFAQDTLPMTGKCLSDQEMSEIRGGYELPGGDFLYLSFDFMRLNLVGHNEPDLQSGSGAWVNALNQEVTITRDGDIRCAVNVFQNGGGDGNTVASGEATPLNSVLVDNAFANFSGFASANIISGNWNTGSIINIFNVEIGYFNVSDKLNMNQIQEFFY